MNEHGAVILQFFYKLTNVAIDKENLYTIIFSSLKVLNFTVKPEKTRLLSCLCTASRQIPMVSNNVQLYSSDFHLNGLSLFQKRHLDLL